ARQRRRAVLPGDHGPRRLEAVSVADAGGADRLAPATAEAAVEVRREGGIVGGELAALERAHQLDAAARAVGLVPGGEEGGARLQAEAAVDAGVERGEAAAFTHRLRPPRPGRPADRTSCAARRRAAPRLRGRRRSAPRRCAVPRVRARGSGGPRAPLARAAGDGAGRRSPRRPTGWSRSPGPPRPTR